MSAGHREWIETLRASHDHLVSIVETLSPEDLRGGSYCADWSVAQVLSHLGSAAEIGLLGLNAAVAGEPPPARELYQEIWGRWDALGPDEMAANALVSDEAHVARLESFDDPTLEALRIPAMGREVDVSGAVANRLTEHTLHTWDVEVTRDPKVLLQSAPVELLIDRFGDRIGRMARGDKPAAAPTKLDVTTSDPTRSFGIEIGEEVSCVDAGGGDATLLIPAEALLRLSFGRLDPDHSPAGITASGAVSLDELRVLFPGY